MIDDHWKKHRPWANSRISCRTGNMLWLMWIIVIVWCAASGVVAVQVVQEFLDGGKPEALFGLLFPVIGAGMLAWAIYHTLAWRRFGDTHLQMDPYPGAIGGHVGGTIDVTLPYDPSHRFEVTLSCLYSYMSGSGKNRSRRERLVWQRQGFAHTRSHRGDTRLSILFDVDPELPGAERPATRYHLWRLQVRAALPGVDFSRSYEVPVFPAGPAGERAQFLSELCTEHSAAAEERERKIEDVLNLRQIPGGVEMHYPPFRHWGSKLVGVVAGGIFLVAGVVVTSTQDAMLFGVVFTSIATGILIASLYSLLVGLWVRMDSQGIETIKQLLGVRVRRQQIARADVRELRIKESYSTNSGSKHTVFYKIQAVAHDGRCIDIGFNLAGAETAEQVLDALSLLTGYPRSQA